MTTRILLAALLGAIAMFTWSFIAHMFTPLGELGVSEIPNESAVTSALVANMTAPSFYYFPGTGLGKDASHAERAAAMQKMANEFVNKPSGIIIYSPPGQPFIFGQRLVREFILEFVESLLAAFLLAQTRLLTFFARTGFVVVIGLIAAVTTNLSYWNWYGFPLDYTFGYMIMQIVGFTCSGMVLAWLLKNNAPRAEMV